MSSTILNNVKKVVQQCPFLVRNKNDVTADMIPLLVKNYSGVCPFLYEAKKVDEHNKQTCNSCVAANNNIVMDVPKPAPIIPYIDPNAFAKEKIQNLKNEGRYRVFFDIKRKAGQFPAAVKLGDTNSHMNSTKVEEKNVTVFCNNDYLGMGQHPDVIKAMTNAIITCGSGAGGTRNISGTSPYHSELESELASLHNMEASLVFSSGYVANDATLAYFLYFFDYFI